MLAYVFVIEKNIFSGGELCSFSEQQIGKYLLHPVVAQIKKRTSGIQSLRLAVFSFRAKHA